MITKSQQQETIMELHALIAKERNISEIMSSLISSYEKQIGSYKEYIVILKQEKAA